MKPTADTNGKWFEMEVTEEEYDRFEFEAEFLWTKRINLKGMRLISQRRASQV